MYNALSMHDSTQQTIYSELFRTIENFWELWFSVIIMGTFLELLRTLVPIIFYIENIFGTFGNFSSQ